MNQSDAGVVVFALVVALIGILLTFISFDERIKKLESAALPKSTEQQPTDRTKP